MCFLFFLRIRELLIVEISTVNKFFLRVLRILNTVSFGQFLITRRLLLSIVIFVVIFHGLIEISLCGDEFLLHWGKLLIL